MKNKKFIIKVIIKIIFVLIVVIATILSVNFATKQIKSINKTIIEKKKINYLIKNREEISNKIKADFEQVNPNYENIILGALPSVYNILPLVDEIDKIAKDNNLDQEINFGQPEKLPVTSEQIKISMIGFTINLKNVYPENLISYLEDFEKLPYFASINSMGLSGQGANGWLDNSSINISGKIYARE